jgi:hypothetical protein
VEWLKVKALSSSPNTGKKMYIYISLMSRGKDQNQIGVAFIQGTSDGIRRSLLMGFSTFFLVGLGFEFRASHLHAGALLLEPCLQSILLWFFWRWGLMNCLLGWPLVFLISVFHVVGLLV